MEYPQLRELDIPFHVYPRKDAKSVFYFRAFLGTQILHRSCKTLEREKAIDVARKEIRKVLGISPIEEDRKLDSSAVRGAVAEFIGTRKHVVKPVTLAYIKRFFFWLNKDLGFMQLRELTPSILNSYLRELNDRLKPKPSYWRDVLVRYNQFLSWCVETDKIQRNPLKGYPRPKTWQILPCEDVWEDSELNAVLFALPSDLRRLVLILRYTGIYPMDYYSIRRSHFTRESGVLKLVLKRAKSQSDKQYYRVPIDERIEDLVESCYAETVAPEQKVFVQDHPASYIAWYNLIQKEVRLTWERVLQTKAKPLKALRHTFATDSIERGVPEDVVLTWMGLSPGSTILRKHYLHRKETTRYRWTKKPPQDSESPKFTFSLLPWTKPQY